MNRSCLIILKLLKLSYYNRACKSSMKNTLEQILNQTITEKKKKEKLNDLIKIDSIKFHLIESCRIQETDTKKNPSFNSRRNDIFSNIWKRSYLELFFCFLSRKRESIKGRHRADFESDRNRYSWFNKIPGRSDPFIRKRHRDRKSLS